MAKNNQPQPQAQPQAQPQPKAQPDAPQPPAEKFLPGGLFEKDLESLNMGFLGGFWKPSVVFGLLALALVLGLVGIFTPPRAALPEPTPTLEATSSPIPDTATPTPTQTVTPTVTASPTMTVTPTSTLVPAVDTDKDGLTDAEEEKLGTDPKVSNLRSASDKTQFFISKDTRIKNRVAKVVTGKPTVFLVDVKDVSTATAVEVLMDGAVQMQAVGLESCAAGQQVTLKTETKITGVGGEDFLVQATSSLNAEVLGPMKDNSCKVRIDLYINPTELSDHSNTI